jgi:hypothetical protein
MSPACSLSDISGWRDGVLYPLAGGGRRLTVDPLGSSSILLDPTVVGEEHYSIAEEVREGRSASMGTATNIRSA